MIFVDPCPFLSFLGLEWQIKRKPPCVETLLAIQLDLKLRLASQKAMPHPNAGNP